MLTTIPFEGFYSTRHDDALDRVFHYAFEHCPALHERAFWAVDWAKAHAEYAKAYAQKWLEVHMIKGEFESLHSPREYNFTIDVIFCEVPLEQVIGLYHVTPIELLDKHAAERFTSCSGFISLYSPGWQGWGDVRNWDHNQVGTLMRAYQEHLGVMPEIEADVMEAYSGNGHFDDWVFNTDEAIRCVNAADYLRRRQERRWNVSFGE